MGKAMTDQIEDLIKTLQTDYYDEWEAMKAAEKLGQLRARKAVPALIVALHSQDLLRAWNALDSMTKVAFGGVGEGTSAINELRCTAAEALGKIGNERAVPDLLSVLNSGKSDDLAIFHDVVKALANFTLPEAQAPVENYVEEGIALAQSDDVSLRFKGVIMLGTVPMERSVPIVINALNDSFHMVREEAANALGEIGQKIEDRKLKGKIILALEASLSDTYTMKSTLPRVCDYSAKALENIGTANAMTIVGKWRQEQQETQIE